MTHAGSILTTWPLARRWPVRPLGVGVVVVLVLVVSALYACDVLRQTPFMAGPDRLTICGRDFAGPGDVYRREQLLQDRDSRIGTVMIWQGRREIWGRHLTIGGATGCGTGVYLRVAGDRFRGYAPLGGP
jgi:hypothetical protein